MTNGFEEIDLGSLGLVNGGGWRDTLSDAWTGTKNFAGGAAAGLTYGPNAKTENVSKYADTSSQATKAGFELGATGNMAMGPFGKAMSTAAGGATTGDGG